MKNAKLIWESHVLLRLIVVFLIFLLAAVTAKAQQTTGVPCSPSATTTVDGKYVPAPSRAFGGEINMNVKDSKPCWPPNVVPPKGAPETFDVGVDTRQSVSDDYSVPFRFTGKLVKLTVNLKPEPMSAEEQRLFNEAAMQVNLAAE
jgi:hypothetical protein